MKEAKILTSGPIFKQIMGLALPIMATSFIQMAYTLTDTAWVGRLGSEEVAAIGTVAIMVWFTAGITLLTKVGAEVTISQAIGIKELDKARRYASHNFTLSFILSLLLGSLLFFGATPIIGIFKLSANITTMGVDYLHIISSAFPFIFSAATFTGIYNAAGHSKIPFYISGMGLLLNMLLDPLFIFYLDWGISGAAIATWLSQAVVTGLFIYKIHYKDRLLNRFPFFCRLRRIETKQIAKIGIPVASFNALFGFANMFLARLASEQGGHIGMMCLSTGAQIEALTWNTFQGVSTALSTFVAQNYAAQQFNRILKAFKLTLKLGAGLGTFTTLLFVFFGEQIFSIFVPEKAAYTAGGEYLFILGFSQFFMILEITMQGMFYGMGRTMPPAINSISANYLRIPVALLLISVGWGLHAVWWSITFCTILKGIIPLVWFWLIRKKLFQ
ncbi:MAG: MATE family efflux transporter [Bacteroidaceae bacterium]|nr:MATE family efflux transporter [Bacteroidaceae bacterium]